MGTRLSICATVSRIVPLSRTASIASAENAVLQKGIGGNAVTALNVDAFEQAGRAVHPRGEKQLTLTRRTKLHQMRAVTCGNLQREKASQRRDA